MNEDVKKHLNVMHGKASANLTPDEIAKLKEENPVMNIVTGEPYFQGGEKNIAEQIKEVGIRNWYPTITKAGNNVQVKHDGLPSGYITDKELFEWALDAVERRLEELKNEWFDYVGEQPRITHWTCEMDRIMKAQESVKAKRLYLKEVLDGLG